MFAANFQLLPEKIPASQPAKKTFYSKGKGVFGLITGLCIGPVGYAAVCIFSHNRITRKRAFLGMEIWTGVALSALIILLILKNGGFKGLGKGSGAKGTGPNIDLGNLDASYPGSNKRNRKQAMPVIPIIPIIVMP